MIEDLSTRHEPITGLFKLPGSRENSKGFRLSDEQVAFYKEHGYVAGVRMLDDEQVEVLLDELASLMDPRQETNTLFYEYHSNESPDSATTLFHALGAWRISAAFHDLLWNPAFTVPASQLL
ncbi:MAG TPA: phytanoyl-CoA dioxygenase family protein, partial [Blastocatellia bacterium]|nr:phytanoyl-CoA dioxygenase family protein [Blastocatellia bacterium]